MPAYGDYALQKSQNEPPETIRLRTYFAGNLDQVALEMTERYRGRSKRMAFNDLLRSVKGATLRRESDGQLHQMNKEDVRTTDRIEDDSDSVDLIHVSHNIYSPSDNIAEDIDDMFRYSSSTDVVINESNQSHVSAFWSFRSTNTPSIQLSGSINASRKSTVNLFNQTKVNAADKILMSHDLLRQAAVSPLTVKIYKRRKSSNENTTNSSETVPSSILNPISSLSSENMKSPYSLSSTPISISSKYIKSISRRPVHQNSAYNATLKSSGSHVIDIPYNINKSTDHIVSQSEDWSDYMTSSPSNDDFKEKEI